jgi:hypothetical protein
MTNVRVSTGEQTHPCTIVRPYFAWMVGCSDTGFGELSSKPTSGQRRGRPPEKR